ncbi:uridine kinase [Candidatus Pelagibacter communis]|uniref:uridine kinase n=1 Tax=Pelagibacter ubique TaxID=198252 RepID=UPI00092D288E|nr:uridine kinase [Candidatus Pelagibacter ubique]
MKLSEECFKKVKKDCFKFIKTQETSTEKFGNKERMIKNFLIPICFWISKKADKKKPYFVGLAGGQGTGKTTISSIIRIILEKYFKLKVFKISIDDFYKTRKERIALSKKVHPMLLTRGVPGTHDINMMLNFFKKSKSKKFKKMKLPSFNKAIDDRFPKNKWSKINKRPDVIIFEGWCVGARAETEKTLKKSINSMEKANDHKLVWRKFVNQQLKTKYKKLYSQLNCMIYLKAKNFSLLQKWRLKQEHKLWLKTKKKGSHKIMSKGDVINFMQTYQRITQNMFKNMPKYASIILNLNSNHQIKTAVYKSK